MRRVQRFFLFCILAIGMFGLVRPVFAELKIESVSGREVVLSAGAADGVKVGMTGVVKATMSAGGRMVTLDIASFKVTDVGDRTSRAHLMEIGQGFTVDEGLAVGFDQELRVPASDKGRLVVRSNVSDQKGTLLFSWSSSLAIGVDSPSPAFGVAQCARPLDAFSSRATESKSGECRP